MEEKLWIDNAELLDEMLNFLAKDNYNTISETNLKYLMILTSSFLTNFNELNLISIKLGNIVIPSAKLIDALNENIKKSYDKMHYYKKAAEYCKKAKLKFKKLDITTDVEWAEIRDIRTNLYDMVFNYALAVYQNKASALLNIKTIELTD